MRLPPMGQTRMILGSGLFPSTGTTETHVPASFTLIDNDKVSTQITLSFDPASLSEEEAAKTVTVTATLNGRVLKKSVTVGLIVLIIPVLMLRVGVPTQR